MRVHAFFVVSALAAALPFAVRNEPVKPEPSELQMEASFSQFLSDLDANSEIQLAAFKKHSCKQSSVSSGHFCSFTYSMEKPVAPASVLPAHATLSGRFFANDDGEIRFEMLIG